MPQRTGEKYSAKKRFDLFLLLICLLLVVNTLYLMNMQAQMNRMAKSLSQIASSLTASIQDAENSVGPAPTQQEKTVASSRYQSAPEEAVKPQEVDYVNLCGLPEVDKPVDRTPAQVLKRLEELAEDDEVIARIYKNNTRYSDDMLDALANNPEMADFVDNFLTVDKRATGTGLTEAEKNQEYPLFLQWDPRWGYAEYGDDSNIGLAGCGPTCLSMMLYYLKGDGSLTPDIIAEYSMGNGYYMSGTGTAWKLLEDVPAMYGVSVTQPKASEKTFQKVLDEGSIIICSMKPGDFTAGGHFVVIYDYNDDGFRINDPNCVARSRKTWTFEEIRRQIKHTWVYEK
jgi:hypothetical protein